MIAVARSAPLAQARRAVETTHESVGLGVILPVNPVGLTPATNPDHAPIQGRGGRENDPEKAKAVEKQAEAMQAVPVRLRGLVARAFEGKSLRSCVSAKCLECLGYEDREGITDCRGYTCPLWRVRPYQKKAGQS